MEKPSPPPFWRRMDAQLMPTSWFGEKNFSRNSIFTNPLFNECVKMFSLSCMFCSVNLVLLQWARNDEDKATEEGIRQLFKSIGIPVVDAVFAGTILPE